MAAARDDILEAVETTLSPPFTVTSAPHLQGETDVHDVAGSDHSHHMHTVMEGIRGVQSPKTIKHIIESLQHRLHSLYGTAVESAPSTTASPVSIAANETFASSTGAEDEESISVAFHPDTIILVGSCVVMIVVGLVLRRAFSYFTRLRKRRERYRHGLKRFAENMHVVTRTMSMDPNTTFAHETPKIKIKLSHSLPPHGAQIQETSMSLHHLGLRDPVQWQRSNADSLQADMSQTQKQMEARRISRFQTYFSNMED